MDQNVHDQEDLRETFSRQTYGAKLDHAPPFVLG